MVEKNKNNKIQLHIISSFLYFLKIILIELKLIYVLNKSGLI